MNTILYSSKAAATLTRPARSAPLSLFELGLESQTVIWLRMLKLGCGGSEAVAETQRMITEKVNAAIIVNGYLTAGLLTGSLSVGHQKAVAHYRRKVRANRRRLSR